MTQLAFVILCALFLFGCTVQKDFVPITGNRAGGTVKMGFTYDLFERPQVDGYQAGAAATQACRAWGYQGAQPFGAVMQQCVHATSSGCDRWMVSADFQCTVSH